MDAGFDWMASRVDDTLARARAAAYALDGARDQLAGLADTQRDHTVAQRRRVLDELTAELGG